MDIVKRLGQNLDRLLLAVLYALAEFNVIEITDEQVLRLEAVVLLVMLIVFGVVAQSARNAAK